MTRPTLDPMPFRHAPAVRPAWAVAIPTCDRCGETLLDRRTSAELDAALEAGLEGIQRALVSTAIERLAATRPQRDWEKRLGLSAGYLSRLKTGKESSVVLSTLLALLAESPTTAWERLGRLWSAPAAVAAVVGTGAGSVRGRRARSR